MVSVSTLKYLRPLLAITTAVVLCHCSTPVTEDFKSDLPHGAWWTTTHASGSTKIVISLDEQRVALFKGGQIVGLSPISSGREGHGTRSGNFRISQKDEAHRSSLYGAYVDGDGYVVVEDVDVRKTPKPPGTRFLGADMHWFMRVNGAIGMHRGYLPGYPASHGCIRLPGTMASLFFHATPHGTPVEIRDNAGLIALHPKHEATLPVAVTTSALPAPATSSAVPASITPPIPGRPATVSQPKPSKSSKSKRPRPGATLYWDGVP